MKMCNSLKLSMTYVHLLCAIS